MENPFESGSRNIFTDPLQSHNAPVLNNFNDEIEDESSRNRSTLINDVNEDGKGDTNEVLNDTASTHLSENSNMESFSRFILWGGTTSETSSSTYILSYVAMLQVCF
ncbi:hypothetical protein CEXT_759011 [Caerostris extrusa]|uniref:Uncharacterized protein n=1 Tax=Caerostris extrusa TaxID=172846 RepID=A0AAV4NKH4_CAEEX|nr:hypothetical protein CEXT_759011 [Caerostris extrusa]